jgi:hypothetical protein
VSVGLGEVENEGKLGSRGMNGGGLHRWISVDMYGSMLTGNVVKGSRNSNGCRGIVTSGSSELVREMLLHELGVFAEIDLVLQDLSTGLSWSLFRR